MRGTFIFQAFFFFFFFFRHDIFFKFLGFSWSLEREKTKSTAQPFSKKYCLLMLKYTFLEKHCSSFKKKESGVCTGGNYTIPTILSQKKKKSFVLLVCCRSHDQKQNKGTKKEVFRLLPCSFWKCVQFCEKEGGEGQPNSLFGYSK